MGKKARLKRPTPEQGKRLSLPDENPKDYDSLPPRFCLRQLRTGFSLADCQKDEKAAFADRLFEISRLSWAQLRQAGRHGQGYEKISWSAIKGDAIPSSFSADLVLIAFRCIGKAAMVGYRSADGVFNILWIDRAFRLYDHG
jgi:hypothetical protein